MATKAAPSRRSGRLMTAEEVSSATKNGLNISGTFVQEVKAPLAPRPLGLQKSGIRGPQTPPKVFRFMDLPAELRTRIYSYAVQPEHGGKRNLRDFKQPAITAVSKLVREESLPVLFSDCSFKLVVGCNATMFERGYDIYMTQAGIYYRTRDRPRAGTLGIMRGVMKGLREVGEAAIIRDITFQARPVDEVYRQASAVDNTKYPSLHIITQPSIVGVVKPSTRILSQSSRNLENRVMAKPAAMAAEIGAAAGFKGLRLVDLDRIAKCFRL